jgi:hypothetical protein
MGVVTEEALFSVTSERRVDAALRTRKLGGCASWCCSLA